MVPLRSSFQRLELFSSNNEKSCRRSIGINCIDGDYWTYDSDVMHRSHSVKRIKGVWGIYKQCGICLIRLEDIVHRMDGGLATGFVTCAHTCVAPLASITSCFPILETHLPINLLITSPTPIGRTSPLPLSKGIRRFDRISSMVSNPHIPCKVSLWVLQESRISWYLISWKTCKQVFSWSPWHPHPRVHQNPLFLGQLLLSSRH